MDCGLHASVPTVDRVELASSAARACALIEARQTVLPKRLAAPGPDGGQLQQILRAAGAAPDHGERIPWRFVIVPPPARTALAEVFAQSLAERDPAATAQQLAQAREKAHRAPLLLLAVARLAPTAADKAPDDERLVSAGCAIQNMLLIATAQGFGSALTSGKALQSPGLRALFALKAYERALCFINIGTAASSRLRRARPLPADYVSALEPIP